MIIIN